MSLTTIQILAIIGFVLSAYFLNIKWKIKLNKNFKALCDLSDRVSCSKAVKSKYSGIFIVPNALLGIIFYVLVFVLDLFTMNLYIFILSILALVFSVYLIFLSFKIGVACVVCITTYIINFFIFGFSLFSII